MLHLNFSSEQTTKTLCIWEQNRTWLGIIITRKPKNGGKQHGRIHTLCKNRPSYNRLVLLLINHENCPDNLLDIIGA
jgi:hypothetical protein